RHTKPDGVQAGQNLPAAVDVVYPPAADPAAPAILRLAQKRQRPIDLLIPRLEAVMPQRLQDTCRNIRTAGVEHGVMVGKRNLGENLAVDVAVERRPAAVAVLHPEQPVDATLLRRSQGTRVRGQGRGVLSIEY